MSAAGRQVDKHGHAGRAHEIAEVDDTPCTQNLAHMHLAAGARHDHQSVAGEQLGSSDDDQDQPQRKHKAGQEADHAIGDDANTLADARLAAQKISRERCLPVAGRERMQRAKSKRQPCSAETTCSQFRSQRPDNAALERTQIGDQPIRHCLRSTLIAVFGG